MDNQQHQHTSGTNNRWQATEGSSGRIYGGLIIMLVGAALLVRQLDLIALPHWLFSWQMLLIVIGVFTGAKSSFRNIGWIFPFLVGLFFLLDDLIPDLSIRPYLWPILIIAAGLLVMRGPGLRSHRRHSYAGRPFGEEEIEEVVRQEEAKKTYKQHTYPSGQEEYIDSVSVFGGVKKNIISKDFKGGEIVNIFGGAEYNLSHADINGDVVLEVVQLFGGTRLVVPPHWEVKTEMVAVMGSVEDKRPILQNNNYEPGKRLILRGTSIFGGIDIRSYY